MRYSATTNGFYPEDVDYGTSLPSDLVEITEQKYRELLEGQNNGKVIVSDPDGNPYLSDAPGASPEQLIKEAEQTKKQLLSECNTYTQPWQTQLLLGIISEDDKASLIEWMKYYQQLQAVDTSKPEKIKWPKAPTS